MLREIPRRVWKIVEPGDAEERVAHDEEAPPFADDFEALRDRTVQVLEAGSLHKVSLVGCVIERTSVD